MRKGYKILGIIVLSLIINFSFIIRPSAANASISVKASKSSVAVGGSFNVTVTVYSSSSLGAWEYNLNYDSSKLTLISTNVAPHVADYASGAGKNSASYTYTFKAKGVGNASISVGSYSVIDWSENQLSTTGGQTSVKVLSQAEIEASYSKNNNLKSLSVEGTELSPAFNKDTLEYNVELESETKSIVVNATKEDETASITGAGEIEVSEGNNKIDIVVTAQNGASKTYVINAKVKELSPINIKINGSELTVVRQKDALPIPEFYTETTVKIGEEEVPAFTSDITKLTLLGLKDKNGNIKLYIYDSKKDSYTPYNEIKSSNIILYQLDISKTKQVPKEYKKYTIKIDGNEIECYKLTKNSKFALVYGMNIETGKKGWYLYNTTEKTLQLYYDEEINLLNKKIDNYSIIVLGLGALSVLLALILLIVCMKIFSNKKKRKLKNN